MEVQTTPRPKCKTNEAEPSQVGTAWQWAKRALISFAKSMLIRFLLNPTTYRWMLVHMPEIGEKVAHVLAKLFHFFADPF